MSRPSSTPLSRELQESIQQLRQMGGPFVLRVQRRREFGTPEEIDQWEGVTQDDLGNDLAGRLWDNAGGGTFLLTVFTPDNRVIPKHQFSLVVPGEPRLPTRYAGTPTGVSPMASFPSSPSPWSSVPGIGMPGAVSPWYQNPYGFLGPLAAAGIPVAASSGSTWEDEVKTETARIRLATQERQQRMADAEDFDRRRRREREEAAEAQQQARMADPLYLKMIGVGPSSTAPVGPSPELVQMQATVEGLKAALAAEQTARARDDANRQAQESERRLREEVARQQADAEARRREADDRHRQELERLRAEAVERDRKADEDRRRTEEERRRADEKHEREMEALKTLIEAKGSGKSDHAEELRRLEEKFLNTTERQREAEERRRIEEEGRRRDEQLRNELAEQRRAAEAKHTELVLAATKPKDDSAMLTALSGIFGTTLQGSQKSSESVLQAITAIMASAQKNSELPEWMGAILAKATSRGDEMAQVAQASGQIMSVALGAVGQVLQHMAGNHESPWLQIADSAFREIGSIGTALIQRGAGGPAIPMPSPDAGAIPTTATQVALPAPSEVTLTDAPAQAGGAVVHEKNVPLDRAPVDASEPVSPSQILATRVAQLRHSIRKNGLPAQAAAQAFVETVEFEAAYTGKLPHPLDQIGDDPRGVVDKLFGQWLRQFKGGDQYAETMASWVEKFVREGLPEDEEEDEASEEEAASEGPPEAAGASEAGAVGHPAAPRVAPATTEGDGSGATVVARGRRGRRAAPEPPTAAPDAPAPTNGEASAPALVEPELVEAIPEG